MSTKLSKTYASRHTFPVDTIKRHYRTAGWSKLVWQKCTQSKALDKWIYFPKKLHSVYRTTNPSAEASVPYFCEFFFILLLWIFLQNDVSNNLSLRISVQLRIVWQKNHRRTKTNPFLDWLSFACREFVDWTYSIRSIYLLHTSGYILIFLFLIYNSIHMMYGSMFERRRKKKDV